MINEQFGPKNTHCRCRTKRGGESLGDTCTEDESFVAKFSYLSSLTWEDGTSEGEGETQKVGYPHSKLLRKDDG